MLPFNFGNEVSLFAGARSVSLPVEIRVTSVLPGEFFLNGPSCVPGSFLDHFIASAVIAIDSL